VMWRRSCGLEGKLQVFDPKQCCVIRKPLKPEVATDERRIMNKLCIIAGMTIVGWVGWWIGARFGFMTGFILSCIGSMIGVYLGWRINRDYFG
jgi:hypothetical protein